MRILCLRALFAEQIFDFDGIMARARFFFIRIVLLVRSATVCSERGEGLACCVYCILHTCRELYSD